jgi:N12 class adenine-specific DNA methylase
MWNSSRLQGANNSRHQDGNNSRYQGGNNSRYQGGNNSRYADIRVGITADISVGITAHIMVGIPAHFRKLCNAELYDLYPSPNIILVRLAVQIARTERREMHKRIRRKRLNAIHHLQGLGVDGRIILKRTLEKQNRKAWNRFIRHTLITSEELL